MQLNRCLIFVMSLLPLLAFAENFPMAIKQAAERLKKSDIRAIITEVENNIKNPCLPPGKSYQIELQVKEATWNPIKSKVDYFWKTTKKVNSNQAGKIQEVCVE